MISWGKKRGDKTLRSAVETVDHFTKKVAKILSSLTSFSLITRRKKAAIWVGFSRMGFYFLEIKKVLGTA